MEQPVEQRDIVIKVKHGDVLRRFVIHISGDSMDHNMSNLRTKIMNLFKFGEDADLLLTYTDIDGDVVTLSSDDELYDAAINQHLNPLRIVIHVSGDASKNDATNTSRSSSSSRSMPGLEFLPPQVSVTVEDSLRNMPKAVHSLVTKISEEVSKVASASPVMIELKDFLTKLGKVHNVCTPGISSSTHKDMNGSSDANVSSKPAAPADLSYPTLPTPGKFSWSALGKEQLKTGSKVEAQKVDAQDKGKYVSGTASFSRPFTSRQQRICLSSEPSTDIPIVDGSSKKPCESSVPPSNFCRNLENCFTSSQQTSSVPPLGCQYGGWNCLSELRRRGLPRSDDDWIPVFHRGIRCDACGMQPIVGPRYKSKVRNNYDLCKICFSQIGNEMDYTRMNHPVYRPRRTFREFCAPHPVDHTFGNWGMRHPKEKLESRFIHDVTILDGTLIEPSTKFTKIWRLRNNGSASWPPGTQLVWIGGDVFSDKMAVELEIPIIGFPPGEEIDVAVDFQAPLMPGRYFSDWRLASPHGWKFGQRVWVLIQVDKCGSVWQNGGAPFQFNWNVANKTEGYPKPLVEFHNSNPDLLQVDIELDKPSSHEISGASGVPIEFSQAATPLASGPVMPEMDLPVPPSYSVTDSSIVTSKPVTSPVSFLPIHIVGTAPTPSCAPPKVNPSVSYPVVAPALASSPTPPDSSATSFEPILDDAIPVASGHIMPEMDLPAPPPYSVVDSSIVTSKPDTSPVSFLPIHVADTALTPSCVPPKVNPLESYPVVAPALASSPAPPDSSATSFEPILDVAIPVASGHIMPEMDLPVPPPYSVTDSPTVASKTVSSPVSFLPFPVVDTAPSSSVVPPKVISSASYPVVAPVLASSPTPPDSSATSFEPILDDAIPVASGYVICEMDLPIPSSYSVTDSPTVTPKPVSSPDSFLPFPVVDTTPSPPSVPPKVNSSVSYSVVAPASASSPTPPTPTSASSPTPQTPASASSPTPSTPASAPSSTPTPASAPSSTPTPASASSPTPQDSSASFEPILDDATEQALLKELEELGFKEDELNREILRKNDYDLEQSVNDLCNVAEWDLALEGLEEMGSHDKEKNIKLLAKNNGSFKQAVLDLISGKKWI